MQQIQQTVQQKSEAVQSAISYGIGGGVSVGAWLVEAGAIAQSMAFILGVAVVAVRLVHDVHRYIRWARRN